MRIIYLTTDSDEVLKFILTEEQYHFLRTLERNDLLREDIEIKANTEEILVYNAKNKMKVRKIK